jgi:rubrerythrin
MKKEIKMYSSYEILQMALLKERQAYGFYGDLAAGCPNEQLKDLLEKLRDEENKHMQMIEAMLTKLNLGHEPL